MCDLEREEKDYHQLKKKKVEGISFIEIISSTLDLSVGIIFLYSKNLIGIFSSQYKKEKSNSDVRTQGLFFKDK